MAEEQKNIEVPQETKPELATTGISAPAVEAPVETKPVDETPIVAAETTPVVEDKTAEETKPVEEAAKAEEKKEEEEIKPVEEGHLNHKAQGLSFPKNLIASKEFFFFGTDAVEPKTLSHYLKSEKSTETAHSNIAWASETGKGLLFVGDKKNPSGVIGLADATEPEIDGSHKFHLTSKGNKHTFKASSTAERDNWVSQLKLKIAEAKELATTIVESETYKTTLESFKPAPVKKEEKVAEATKEETPAAAVVAPTTEEAAPVVEEAPKEEEVKDVKAEEPKRRSASRKRTSFFGFGKKDEAKKDEVKKEAETRTGDEVAVETPALETPKIEEPVKPAEEVAPVIPVAVEEPAKPVDETPVEAVPATTEPLESPKEKPTATKRNSFFGNVFSKKEKRTPELKPTEPEAVNDADAETTAPVIPPVEATTPLAVDVSSPATVPAETTEAATATSPTPEAKKDLKEKRKSSLPFAFGKRDKSPAPVEGEKKESPFSKLRNTIRGKSPKPAEKRAEENKEETLQEEPTEIKADEAKTEEAPKVEEPVAATETEAEAKPKDAAPAPVVTAAA
ncbi:Pleckstrin homology domain-containing protein [Fusarium acuminatum]|uniref:Pleckstrin homology domain-containing protein n=1 Tax=Fusarium acuminatum TaxID=5515 RepID=A0ABZ2WIA8_9HYPO